jgi:hypothetical protein
VEIRVPDRPQGVEDGSLRHGRRRAGKHTR